MLVDPLAEDVVGGPVWLDLLAVSAGTLPLAWRRQAPFWVSLVIFGSIGARALAGDPLELYPPAIAGLVATYTVASYAPLRDAVLAAAFAALSLSVAVVNGTGTDSAPDPLASAILYGSVWLVGRVVGVRQERARELHEARDQHAAEAVAEERARASLASIEAAGRRGLEEMRRMLGLVGETESARAPQPGLDRLEELVEAARDTGLRVELQVVGERRAVPPSVDVSAYRIVQESLTNVMKHAGASAVRVVLGYGPEDVTVEVLDDGGAAGPATDRGVDGAGRGLAGMRERAQLLGGTLDASDTGAGFRVAARLPT